MAEPNLELLQTMVQRVLDVLARHTNELGEIKQRLTTIELQVGGLVGAEQSHYAVTMQRFDQIEKRLERLERRDDLADGPGVGTPI
jgi:tetrahydromethanopterin S-methyltransferase subunit G